MAYKQSKHLFQGMSKDLSDDKQKGIYYIDAHNIRITAREDTTLLSVTNEKGNKALRIKDKNGYKFVLGQYIGHAVLNNYLVLFTVYNEQSYIWRLDLSDLNDVEAKQLYKGNLGFDKSHPIETLVDYETEDIQKVYWTDGDNQPRVINIVSDSIKPNVDTQFDFVPEVFPNGVNNLNISIEKLINTGGLFVSGTIQYFISYYNKFGQESNVVWQSPLLYISPEDRGGNVSESIANAFQITINTPSTTFDYIRIYSVQHTSEDTDLVGRRIIDLQIPVDGTSSLVFIDNGTIGEAINVADLYYKGGVPTSVGTLTAKDQTLFLGNINLKNNPKLDSDLVTAIHNLKINYTLEEACLADDATGQLYAYKNQLNEVNQFEIINHPGLRAYPRSHSIKSFKSLETYRFGLQFQDKCGRWSEPVFIGDFKNPLYPQIIPSIDNNYIYLPVARVTDFSSIKQMLLDAGYVMVRPIIVLPQENERECVAQGVLCPTVYNVLDRKENSPFAQPSWFFRPYSDTPHISSGVQHIGYENSQGKIQEGTVLPFIHNSRILGSTSLQGEIEKAPNTQVPPVAITSGGTSYSDTDFFVDQSIVTLNSPDIEFTDDNFDYSSLALRIVGAIGITGFSGTLNLNTSTPQNRWSQTNPESTSAYPDGTQAPYTKGLAYGYADRNIRIVNYNYTNGWKIMGNGPYWIDTPYRWWDSKTDAGYYTSEFQYGFVLYPWQATGALNGTSNKSNKNIPLSAELRSKTFSNLRYSNQTTYLSTPITLKTSDIAHINSDITDTYTLKARQFSENPENLIYYSKIDKLLNAPTPTEFSENNLHIDINLESDITVNNVRVLSSTSLSEEVRAAILNENSGALTYNTLRAKVNSEYSGDVRFIPGHNKFEIKAKNSEISTKDTATSITYNTIKHAVAVLDNIPLYKERATGIQTTEERNAQGELNEHFGDAYVILPSVNSNGKIDTIPLDASGNYPVPYGAHRLTGQSGYNMIEGLHKIISNVYSPGIHNYCFWDSYITSIYQENLTIPSIAGGTLLLGELYRPDIDAINKFGGTTDDAIQQNVWIPAGKAVKIADTSINTSLTWTEGDTYFQRYDCLKTYPYSNESENNIIEILSFMCETRINIAGRYDKNRGLVDNTFITNENFNLLNKGYTQKDNFFSYRILDSRFGLEKFKTQLTWTKVKTAGALVDNWTNVTLQNTLDLDGNKGELVSLNRYANDIIAFQPKGISQIIYNPNVQINTTSGLPIEVANSGKVQSKRYLYEGVGCQNKWSICDEVYGNLYFVDNYAKSIFKLSQEGLISLTDTKGFREWMENNSTVEAWTPYDYRTSATGVRESIVPTPFRTYYDKTFKDIYFVNKNVCLVYSELLNQFVSFMDYEQTNAMFNLEDNFFAIYNKNIYHQFEGAYNSIYTEDRDNKRPRPYSITFIDNQIPEMNKIFTNLEFRSDSYENNNLVSDVTFDEIRVYNEYQDTGYVDIKAVLDKPYLSNNLQKKFRVWRIQLPREKDNPLNRINNTWAKITLRKSRKSNEQTVLHDAVVGYYI